MPQTPPSDALTLSGISKHFGSLAAVSDVNLSIPRGSFVCFLGPSGCGKTTLLRMVAGLESPTSGVVMLEGEDVTHLPAHKRDLGMVFQSLALFPHLNVAGNVAYGMRQHRYSKAEREKRVRELLQLVHLPDVGGRAINQLSGGQRQRVAIARALALKPRLFLLDEPLSALDAKLHEEMQVELKLLQQRVGVTTIMVTHNQREAMSVADLIVVMSAGEIQQVGEPLEIYRHPRNVFVADFIGANNLLKGEVLFDGFIQASGHRLHVPGADELEPGLELTVSIRPEDVRLHVGTCEGENLLEGNVALVRDVGQSVEVYVDCDDARIIAHAQPGALPGLKSGDRVTVGLPPEKCVVLRE